MLFSAVFRTCCRNFLFHVYSFSQNEWVLGKTDFRILSVSMECWVFSNRPIFKEVSLVAFDWFLYLNPHLCFLNFRYQQCRNSRPIASFCIYCKDLFFLHGNACLVWSSFVGRIVVISAVELSDLSCSEHIFLWERRVIPVLWHFWELWDLTSFPSV